MAGQTYTVAAGARATHDHTLTANQADTVAFASTPGQVDVHPGLVEILSDGAADLYVSTDGSPATVSGASTCKIPLGGPSATTLELPSGSASISLISSGTPKYSVTKANWL